MQAETFFQYCTKAGEGDDEDDELSLAAYSCLEAILTVLEGIQSRADIFLELENVLCSVRHYHLLMLANCFSEPIAPFAIAAWCTRYRWWRNCSIPRASTWSISRTR